MPLFCLAQKNSSYKAFCIPEAVEKQDSKTILSHSPIYYSYYPLLLLF